MSGQGESMALANRAIGVIERPSSSFYSIAFQSLIEVNVRRAGSSPG
jgi:hypothetical protein